MYGPPPNPRLEKVLVIPPYENEGLWSVTMQWESGLGLCYEALDERSAHFFVREMSRYNLTDIDEGNRIFQNARVKVEVMRDGG